MQLGNSNSSLGARRYESEKIMTSSQDKVVIYSHSQIPDKNKVEQQLAEKLNPFRMADYVFVEEDQIKAGMGGGAVDRALGSDFYQVLAVPNISDFCSNFESENMLLTFLEMLSENKIRFISLNNDLDINASEAQFVLQVLKEFRTKSFEAKSKSVREALRLAKEEGKSLGRPQKLNSNTIFALREKGLTMMEVAKLLNISVGSVHRVLEKGNELR